MKKTLAALALLTLSAAPASAEEPVSVVVRTRNWQGYAFQTSVSADGRYERRFRKDGGPDLSEAPVIEEGTISAANLKHLSKVVEHSGVLALDEDMVKKDFSTGAEKDRFEGELRVKRGAAAEKAVRFGPNVTSIPDGVFEVLDELSRLTQEKR